MGPATPTASADEPGGEAVVATDAGDGGIDPGAGAGGHPPLDPRSQSGFFDSKAVAHRGQRP
jgi:hypothetical protein